MIFERFKRLAPGGSAISGSALLRVLHQRDPETTLRRELGQRFENRTITLHASGRDALRVAFTQLATATDRKEIAVPAYSCFSIPAAAVAAGLRVRLVDINDAGQVDLEALGRCPLENVAALVVSNLFGVAEPTSELLARTRSAGVKLIDDAAQSLGARSKEGIVGARGDVGVLSFGRGKPISALGGGALIWKAPAPSDPNSEPTAANQRFVALARAIAYDGARLPIPMHMLAAIPALGIGTTEYDPGFEQGSISHAAVTLAAAISPDLDAANRARSERAESIATRLRSETGFKPLSPPPGEVGIYPRLAVVAPSTEQRNAALAALVGLGATAMYPAPLNSIPDLRPHLADESDCPIAARFCARLLTFPTHSGMGPRQVDRLISVLRGICRG